jgi:hypothetical protein
MKINLHRRTSATGWKFCYSFDAKNGGHEDQFFIKHMIDNDCMCVTCGDTMWEIAQDELTAPVAPAPAAPKRAATPRTIPQQHFLNLD